MPSEVRDAIADDLSSRDSLRAFVKHETITDDEVTGRQTLAFNITFPKFQIGNIDQDGKPVNLSSYNPDRIDRHLRLGDVDEWTLKSFTGGHPFHIHVNPFQIVEVLNEKGEDVSGSDAGNSTQYAGLKGAWKDTLFVQGGDYTIVLRTRYERYIGDFVLHCHILDHEDRGMMQNVRISLP